MSANRILEPATERTISHSVAEACSEKLATEANASETRKGKWTAQPVADRGQWRACAVFVSDDQWHSRASYPAYALWAANRPAK